jgi:hypothetical protein
MWHDPMCQSHTLVANYYWLGVTFIFRCNLIVTCNENATCQQNQSWLIIAISMVCTFYYIDVQLVTNLHYCTTPSFYNLTFYLLIFHISMGQL